ncbi:MAG: NUDIX domain-containing protein [bacterium]
MKQTTLEEISAGGVVFRRRRKTDDRRQKLDSSEVEFLIGKHSGYHKWVLPKGLVEVGESSLEAAIREVAEEVGVEAKRVGSDPIETIEYWYYADLDTSGKTTRRVVKYAESGGTKTRMHKQVVFYLMEMEKDLGKEGWEMEERRWVSFLEGMKLLAFETEREVFVKADKQLL